MTRKEFLVYIKTVTVIEKNVAAVEEKYSERLPELIEKIVSCANECVFFDDGWRLLSIREIVDASEDLHVNFVEQKILPLFDTEDNDFIVYHFEKNNWSKFNIIDGCHFKRKQKLEEYFD